ncbi:TPA: hypothetical protein ACWV4W_005462 [Salmonella enterica subsp. enterica serovar Muenchen]|nr:hypothetical protein [Salmonella enterica subsp. enterica serovar Muenchen]EGL1840098.1 hypothetical protein [Salmonella enterica]EGV6906943.1 hypothetical protein [Salmonella enterica]ELN6264418.1 hypothetical protein [Salmonella enterica]
MKSIILRDFTRIIAGFAGVFCIGFSLLLFLGSGFSLWQIFLAITGIVLLVGLRITLSLRKKRNEGIFVKFNNENFHPENEFEINRWDIGHYVGIDTKTGNMLMISIPGKIIKGINCKKLMGYECRGNEITFKFNELTFPFFKTYLSSEKESMEYCNRLDVILSAQFHPTNESNTDFDSFVKDKLQVA